MLNVNSIIKKLSTTLLVALLTLPALSPVMAHTLESASAHSMPIVSLQWAAQRSLELSSQRHLELELQLHPELELPPQRQTELTRAFERTQQTEHASSSCHSDSTANDCPNSSTVLALTHYTSIDPITNHAVFSRFIPKVIHRSYKIDHPPE